MLPLRGYTTFCTPHLWFEILVYKKLLWTLAPPARAFVRQIPLSWETVKDEITGEVYRAR